MLVRGAIPQYKHRMRFAKLPLSGLFVYSTISTIMKSPSLIKVLVFYDRQALRITFLADRVITHPRRIALSLIAFLQSLDCILPAPDLSYPTYTQFEV